MTSVFNQFRFIAAIIEKSILQPVVKEKLIKIIQYYTQFLLAYYINRNAAKEKLNRMKNIIFTMSTCRKSIRFGRCLNHAYNASSMLARIKSTRTPVDLHLYGELSEELFNMVHFFLDSRMLLYRAGVLTTNDTLMDNLFYIGDFGADLSVVIHSTLKLLNLNKQKQELLEKHDQVIAALEHCQSSSSNKGAETLLADVAQQLSALAIQQRQARMKLTIWSIQLISSGNYPPVNIWRRLFGSDCPNTIVGLSGVLSSSLIIYDTVSGIYETLRVKEE